MVPWLLIRFGNNVPAVAPPPSAGGGGVGTFTRRRWRELQDAIEAQHQAEIRAQDLTQKKRAALVRAAAAAEQAIEAAEQAEQRAQSANLERLASLLETASRATATAELVRVANNAIKLAHEIKAAFARQEEEDDEETITLLLLS
jgi:hypothetical protein